MVDTKEADGAFSRGDIAEFLKDEDALKGSLAFRSLSWETKYPHFLIARMLSFHGWRRGYFSLGEFLRFQLPGRFKSQELRTKFSSFLNAEAGLLIRDFIAPDGSVIYNGNRFYPPDNKYYDLFGLLFEVIVSDQYQAKKFLKADSVVIDAGANIGTFSVLAAHHAFKGHVYAFEPVSATFEVLKKNTAPYSAISCFRSGLGDAREAKDILIYPGSTCGSTFEDSGILSARHHRSEDLERERTEVTTIDAFVVEQGISRVDFLKIDTEGYEAKIVKGGKETIRKWKPVIAMSAYHHPHDKESLPRLLADICPAYVCDLHRGCEDDLICYVK